LVTPFSSLYRWTSTGTDSGTKQENQKAPQQFFATKGAVPIRIAKSLSGHIWPSDDSPESRLRKKRVLASLGLMVAGKAVTIQVPFIFKHIVDSLPVDATNAAISSDMATSAGVPIMALLLGYGMSRAAASGFNEYRNAVFAHVAQEAIRKVGLSVFNHVHQLDMQFHLTKNTGQVSRILDRGNRSISFVLNALVFHIGPTLVEVGLVTGLVGYEFGSVCYNTYNADLR
jgi:ABC-type multidrug transport system fused ATPase/permease subunit